MCGASIEDILSRKFQVLDDGFVRVVDSMGSDESIVQAARVSYGEGTKRVREDAALIRYLMGHRHTTPFEMCEIKLHVRVPMDCWRQWIRHRTANVNEYSTRYSVAIDSAQKTNSDAWRLQKPADRQGSEGFLSENEGQKLTARESEVQKLSREVYEERLSLGVAREQARKDLSLCTYTEAYWKIDLHNLLHFLELRMAPAAQFEIREYANVIGNEIVANWVPVTWDAFSNYRLDATTFSRTEAKLISKIYSKDSVGLQEQLQDLGWLQGSRERPSREALEFAEKLSRLGIETPWRSERISDG